MASCNYVTAEYLNLPLIPPYLQPGNHRYLAGVNFASAGAGALAETHKGFVCDLNWRKIIVLQICIPTHFSLSNLILWRIFLLQVIDLKTQLSYFRKVKQQLREERGDTETTTFLSKAIYLFSIGSNDYVERFSTNFSAFHSSSKKDYVGMVVGNLTTVVKVIRTLQASSAWYWRFLCFL